MGGSSHLIGYAFQVMAARGLSSRAIAGGGAVITSSLSLLILVRKRLESLSQYMLRILIKIKISYVIL